MDDDTLVTSFDVFVLMSSCDVTRVTDVTSPALVRWSVINVLLTGAGSLTADARAGAPVAPRDLLLRASNACDISFGWYSSI